MKTLHICIFALLFLITLDSSAQNKDIELLRTINLERNTQLDQTFIVLTHSDGPVSLALPAALITIGFIKKDSLLKQNGVMIASSLVASTIVTLGMKWGFGRDRPFITYPEIEKLVPAGSPAFPSGHTSMAFSTATSLTIAYPKWYVYVPAFTWAALVSYSRMHLGVHYPSDVLVGVAVGSGTAFLSSYFTNKIQEKRRSKKLQL